MSFELDNKILTYLEDNFEDTLKLVEELCGIPAPSGKEEKRAEFCKKWLEAQGAENVYIDEALNTIYPINCDGRDDIVVFLAHTDTVFPDLEPMPFVRDDKYLRAPGVGDDTAPLAMMMMVAKYITQEKLKPSCGVLIVANSGEEGLGNLKGIRQIMKDYAGRVKKVYTFDGTYRSIICKCVGSHRYELSLETKGGHSFSAFGNRNALHAMSQLICKLYECEVPSEGDSRTTYNVGVASGGTSVNTIAQNAKFMYEYRSDSRECLAKMQEFFENTVNTFKAENQDVKISVKLLGDRPCGGDVDPVALEEMIADSISICQKHTGIPCPRRSGSTDCNIPMSLGVPAACVGNYLGTGAHTREETVEIESLHAGLKITAEVILKHF